MNRSRSPIRIVVLMAALALTAVAPARADDWPQWRGPNRDGISKETGLLQQWPEGGPKLLWQVKDLGGGYSTPAVVGERIYLVNNQGNDNEFVEARDVADGKQVWSTRIGKVGNPDQRPSYPGARSTPTIDGDAIYALGSNGDLVCLDLQSGKPRWQKNLRKDFGGKPGEWAYSESPLIDGDAVVVAPGGSQATIVALNKKSGETTWTAAVPGGDEAGYGSTVAATLAGVKQYIQFLKNGVIGVDANSGKFLWRYDRTAKGSPANMFTAIAQDDLVYTGAPRSGGGAVRIKADGDKLEASEAYFEQKLPTAIGGAVLLQDGHLYGTSGPVLVCADFKTGKIKWSERGIGTASLCFADGRLYLHGENNDVALIEPSPDGYRERGRVTPPDAPDRGRSKAWSYPVVANGRLYIRDALSLWCYDVKAQ